MNDLSPADDLSPAQQKMLRAAMARAWLVPHRTPMEIGQYAASVAKQDARISTRRWPVQRGPSLVAAGVGLALVVAIWVGVGYSHEQPPAADGAREYVTQRAQRASISLPDGSRVVLGPETRLRYSVSSSGRARTVVLEGQAYFSVEHDPARSFSIATVRGDIRVLGTAFTVRSYPDDDVTQVAVAEGRVAVSATGDSAPSTATVLQPGDIVQWTSGKTMHVVQGAGGLDAGSWMHGAVAFDKVSLETVIRELERRYDLSITFADAGLAARPVVVTLIDAPASQMLELVTMAADVRFVQDGRHVTIVAN